MVDLDPGQTEAIGRAMAVVRSGGAFKLLGKAGTGKTTTGRALVQQIQDAGYQVVCCAYTNKAVNRMKEVGYPASCCMTVNRLLYATGIVVEIGDWTFDERDIDAVLRGKKGAIKKIMDKVDTSQMLPEEAQETEHNLVKIIKAGRGNRVSSIVPKTEQQLNDDGFSRNTVIVVDELSMLPMDTADELHGLFRSVVFIGDPGQLPPVNSVDTCRYLGCDDEVELKTIHRVQGNDRLLDIIYDLDAGKTPAGTRDIPQKTFDHMTKEGFQFICYTNDGVAWMNEHARRAIGLHGQEPQPNEPLLTVVRAQASRTVVVDDQNEDWLIRNESRLTAQFKGSRGRSGAVYNWEDGKLQSVVFHRTIQKNMILVCKGPPQSVEDIDLYLMPVSVEGDREGRIWLVRTTPFWKMDFRRKKAFRKIGRSMTLDFAYAITAHKAQGSEWSKVAVMIRSVGRREMGDVEAADEIKRWNYTAATRGREDIQLFTSIIGCPYG